MTIQDQVILALTMWRENRGGGTLGMQSVANVIVNRAENHAQSIWTISTAQEQFSSLTAKGDPELTLWPMDGDPTWKQALLLAQQAADGTLADITGGADLYYAPASIEPGAWFTLPNGSQIPFPKGWNPNVVTYLKTIQHQVFFK